MNALVILTSVLAAWFALLGTGKLLALPAMAERASHVGFTPAGYRVIGALELGGAVGLFAGRQVTGIGVAAAVGLLLLLTGAALVHLRAKDRLPALVPALASAALVAAYLAVLL